jgi:ABC-type spermidine/putrescine transport system permease subunit II
MPYLAEMGLADGGRQGADPVYLTIGKGMGITPEQIFRQIELPLAFPVILTGVRVALVTSTGIATKDSKFTTMPPKKCCSSSNFPT